MLKLNAGISRKVGEPEYGSRGASVHLELEVESNLISDPNGLLDRIRKLFAMARDAVDQELAQGGQRVADQRATPGTSNGRLNGTGSRGGGQGRTATASQLRAIRSIGERLNADPDRLAQDAFGVGLDALSLRQASQLIDQLKAQTNGNGR